MKIKLKLTTDELRLVSEKTHPVMGINFNNLSKDNRTVYSIMLDVADKVGKKANGLNRQLSITDSKKTHEVSLKWHEADCLHEFLQGFDSQCYDILSKILKQKVIDQLYQKLL